MHIEIDQSIKIEDNRSSIWAYASRDKAYTVLITNKTKQQIIEGIRLSTKSKTKKAAVLKLFAIGVFLLIENDLDRIQSIVIDREYEGETSESKIKNYVLQYIRRLQPDFETSTLTWGDVKRGSPADRAAYLVHKRKAKPDKIMTADDVLRVLYPEKKKD